MTRVPATLLLWLLLPLLWIGGSALSPAPHPFYIGVTEINHNAAEKSLEVSCKVFAEDLEEVLKKQNKVAIDLAHGARHEQVNPLIERYLQQHLRLQVNGRPVALKFLGFEREAESVYCYLEAQGVAVLKKLDAENTILHDFTQEQINILHVTAGGRRQSAKLNYPAHTASFSF